METGSVLTDHAQFWWAQNAPAERRLCKVDKYDDSLAIYRPDIYETISRSVSSLNQELRDLSLDIHGTRRPLVCHIHTGLLTISCF
jgi:hypothetical protein